MRVLVTGGAGYIGVELCRQLLDAGHDVTLLDRFYFGEEPIADFRDRVTIIKADLRDLEDAWLDGIDAVTHLSGLSNDPTAEYNPEANWQMNSVATEKLVNACKKRGIQRFTFASSASIYDSEVSSHEVNTSPQMCTEDMPVEPRGAYSKSKRYAEEVIVAATDKTFSPVIFRQGTVYGFSNRMRFDLVVNTFIKDALISHQLYLHGGGWMWRPLVDVRDVARVHVLALSAPLEAIAGQIFNVHEENYQIRQLAMLVAGSLGLLEMPISVKLIPAPLPSLVRNYRMSNSKLSRALGFTPSITVLESIEHMLRVMPLDRRDYFLDPVHYNIRWMSLLETVHAGQREFATIY